MSDATQLTPRAMGVGLSQEDTHMKPQYDSQGREVCDIEFAGGGKETYVAYLDDGSPVLEDVMFDGQCLCRDCREGL